MRLLVSQYISFGSDKVKAARDRDDQVWAGSGERSAQVFQGEFWRSGTQGQAAALYQSRINRVERVAAKAG